MQEEADAMSQEEETVSTLKVTQGKLWVFLNMSYKLYSKAGWFCFFRKISSSLLALVTPVVNAEF